MGVAIGIKGWFNILKSINNSSYQLTREQEPYSHLPILKEKHLTKIKLYLFLKKKQLQQLDPPELNEVCLQQTCK